MSFKHVSEHHFMVQFVSRYSEYSDLQPYNYSEKYILLLLNQFRIYYINLMFSFYAVQKSLKNVKI